MRFMFRNDTPSNKLEVSQTSNLDICVEKQNFVTETSGAEKVRFDLDLKVQVSSFGFYVSDTWMCLELGEGEKEIENHGWSRVKSFSQETGAISQQGLWNDPAKMKRPKQHSKSQVQDAHDSLTQLPFFSHIKVRLNKALLSVSALVSSSVHRGGLT